MTMNRVPFELQNSSGTPIRGDICSPETRRGDVAIIICHGFKGFKDWGYFPYVCEQLASRTSFPVISFNFSGGGIGADLQNFTELHLFEANTFTQELDDLGLVIEAALAGDLPNLHGVTRFGLLGHSRGGGIAVLKAAADARVDCLVTWAATADFNRWSEETRAEWRQKGSIEILNTRTKQRMPLGVALLEDTEKNAERLDIEGAAARLTIPFLIIHGSSDESVRLSEGERLAAAAPAALARLEVVESAGHTFGAVHPFQGTTAHLEQVIGLSADWFSEHLS